MHAEYCTSGQRDLSACKNDERIPGWGWSRGRCSLASSRRHGYHDWTRRRQRGL